MKTQLTRRQFSRMAGSALAGLAGLTGAAAWPTSTAQGAQLAPETEQSRYTLKCEYLGRLQVTTGLSQSILTHPSLFSLCSSRLGQTTALVEHWKYTSGEFDAGSNPLLWPDGEATELNLGPWRHPLHTDALCRRQGSDFLFRENCNSYGRAHYVTGQMLESDGYDSLELVHRANAEEAVSRRKFSDDDFDWDAIYDPRGINAQTVRCLDNAHWRFRKDSYSCPVRLRGWQTLSTLTQGFTTPLIACWRFGPSAYQLFFDWNSMIQGCTLQQLRPGLSTLQPFDTIAEGLAQLALLEKTTERELLAWAKDHYGKRDMTSWLGTALYQTTVLDASGLYL